MTSPALLALTAPQQAPQAAVARLTATATTLLGESLSSRAGLYAGLLGRLADVAQRAAPLLTAALNNTATESDLAGIANAQRLASVAERLLNELAHRSERRPRIYAMQWAQSVRQMWADLALTRREFAPTAYLTVDWATAQTIAPVRILPGAEGTLALLHQDPLRAGATWDLPAMADTLTRYVQVRA
ncbi:MAG: hypothetical protein EOM92_19660 [Gammaproteobacteria bacterium]|nr:hypothetical protein [Gammaproteobacteria bacterium]